jgi:hypothetical protein
MSNHATAATLLSFGIFFAAFFWLHRRDGVASYWGTHADRRTNPIGFWFMQFISALLAATFLLCGAGVLLGLLPG